MATSTWKILKLEPYSHHQTPLYCGEGLLMTHLSSWRNAQEEFMKHLNSVDKNIQFTAEEARTRRSFTFPGHSDKTRPRRQAAYHSCIGSQHIQTVPSLGQSTPHFIKIQCGWNPPSQSQNHLLKPPAPKRRKEHLTKALMKCNYPKWALNKVGMKMNSTANKKQKQDRTHSTKQHP